MMDPEPPKASIPRGVRLLVDEKRAAEAGYRVSAVPRVHTLLERRWFSRQHVGMACFCVVWDGLLLLWYASAISNREVLALLFPSAHLVIGAALTYSTLCGFVNRTIISLENGYLAITHRPLPWSGGRRIRTDDLARLGCEATDGNHNARSYDLVAMLRSGEKVPLLKGVPEVDQLRYIERVLEQRIGSVGDRA